MSLTLLTPPPEADVEHFGRTASAAHVREMLVDGGRALATLVSARTGAHVTVLLTARRRGADGRWLPRNTLEGRVGFRDADVIEARDPLLDWSDGYIGRFYRDTGEWKAGREAERARAWAASRIIAYALTGRDPRGTVYLADQCSVCGRQLTDPVSIERGIGPECYGARTGSRSAPRR